MRTTTRIADIDRQIEKLRERRKLLLAKTHERFARAAMKAGLGEFDISEEELDATVAEIVTRFRRKEADNTAS